MRSYMLNPYSNSAKLNNKANHISY